MADVCERRHRQRSEDIGGGGEGEPTRRDGCPETWDLIDERKRTKNARGQTKDSHTYTENT